MAERGKGLFFNSRKQLATKNSSSNQKAFNGVDSPSQMDNVVEIASSSEDEDIVVIPRGTPSQGSQQTSKDAPQSSKWTSLESRSRSPLETPKSRGNQKTSKDAMNSGKASLERGSNSPFETQGSKGKAGGKGSLPHATPLQPPITEVELKLEMDLPKNGRVLMDYEAGAILHRIRDSLTVLADDPNIKIPESFNKALQYCEISNKYTDPESARNILDTLKTHGVTEGEICMIGNTCPESETELYALIPSLKANRRKNEEPIKEVLSKLAELKQA